LIGINYYTYHGYESGKSKMPMEAGMKLFKHPRFRKYRDWFMFDETDPAAGQIASALAHIGQDSTTLHHSDQKTG
ncbi:XRE family transcriptional regulator, partial [Escherichia coli]|nr:XRE family transcriptional regulator [Escherichia coli]